MTNVCITWEYCTTHYDARFDPEANFVDMFECMLSYTHDAIIHNCALFEQEAQ